MLSNKVGDCADVWVEKYPEYHQGFYQGSRKSGAIARATGAARCPTEAIQEAKGDADCSDSWPPECLNHTRLQALALSTT